MYFIKNSYVVFTLSLNFAAQNFPLSIMAT